MAYYTFPGVGPWIGLQERHNALVGNGGFSVALIDATGEKFAASGRVHFAGRTGTKDIRRVLFRFSNVTKAGGSALTLSLQDVSLTAGPPIQPDEVQDETVAIANADATFVTNGWCRTGTLSADRTVTYGDLVSVVWEYDGAGRLGSDAVNISLVGTGPPSKQSACALKTGGSWASSGNAGPNVIFEFSDGTFGSFAESIPCKTYTAHNYHSGSAADEHALSFTPTVNCKVDALRVAMSFGGVSSNADIVLYQGTTALQTVAVDANAVLIGSAGFVDLLIPETTLTAGTAYYVAVKPTSTNDVTVNSIDVDDVNHFSLWSMGLEMAYASRVDAGSWTATTTRRLLAGLRLSAIDQGSGGLPWQGLVTRNIGTY